VWFSLPSEVVNKSNNCIQFWWDLIYIYVVNYTYILFSLTTHIRMKLWTRVTSSCTFRAAVVCVVGVAFSYDRVCLWMNSQFWTWSSCVFCRSIIPLEPTTGRPRWHSSRRLPIVSDGFSPRNPSCCRRLPWPAGGHESSLLLLAALFSSCRCRLVGIHTLVILPARAPTVHLLPCQFYTSPIVRLWVQLALLRLSPQLPTPCCGSPVSSSVSLLPLLRALGL
jgi:hypothetical protein